MITEKSFILPIYDFKVEVAVFDNLKEAQDKFPDFIDESTKACTVEYFKTPKVKIIVPSYKYSSMVHELEHAKNIVWKVKGYKPQEDNDEVDAYLLEYLYDKIDKIIRKHLATQC